MSAKRITRASEASVLVRLIVTKFHKKSFSAIILFFRNCVCCERLRLLRPSNLVCPSLCLSVCLSCYQSLYLGNYELDFDETWWKCWKLGLIDCIKISLRYAARALRYARSAYSVKGVKFFFAFLCVSEHFESNETHFFFYRKFSWARSAKRARAKRARCESVGSIECIKVS